MPGGAGAEALVKWTHRVQGRSSKGHIGAYYTTNLAGLFAMVHDRKIEIWRHRSGLAQGVTGVARRRSTT